MAAPLTLPRGVFDIDGGRHREVTLAAADGWLERAVAGEIGTRAPDPVTRHVLLASCVDRIGGYTEPDAATVAMLARAELDLLALWLRRAVSGEAIRLVVRCVMPSCAELADVDLTVADLLPVADGPDPEWFVVDAGDDGQIVLRPPTGADEEALLHTEGSADQRTAALMARLIRSVAIPGDDDRHGGGIDAEGWLALPAALRHAALVALAERPAAPTTRLEVACPACAAPTEVQLDPLVLLAQDLRAGGDRLLVETHCLAFHYGWSEEEILSLPRLRRWGYLSMLRAELSGEALTGAVGDGW